MAAPGKSQQLHEGTEALEQLYSGYDWFGTGEYVVKFSMSRPANGSVGRAEMPPTRLR